MDCKSGLYLMKIEHLMCWCSKSPINGSIVIHVPQYKSKANRFQWTCRMFWKYKNTGSPSPHLVPCGQCECVLCELSPVAHTDLLSLGGGVKIPQVSANQSRLLISRQPIKLLILTSSQIQSII